MKRWLAAGCLIALVMCVCPSALSAQERPEAPEDQTEEWPQKRRRPSMFHRPTKETPAAQLEYANKLAAEKKTKTGINATVPEEWPCSEEVTHPAIVTAVVISTRTVLTERAICGVRCAPGGNSFTSPL